VPIDVVFSELTSNNEVNPLKILTLFFSMTFLSIYLDEVGLFKYLATLALKLAKNNQMILFVVFYLLTSILTIFTSNDIVILTLTPFICFFCKRANISPIPYLVSEFVAANTWSLMLIIGNPTNIYLATSYNIDFFTYFKVMWLPTLVSGIIEFLILFLLFKNKLKEPLNIECSTYNIENKYSLIIGVIHLLICLIFLIISSYINIEMWIISLICMVSLLILSTITSLITKKGFKYIKGSITKLPYPLIPFFLSMFVIVASLNYQQISNEIYKLLSNLDPIWTYGFSSFLMSNIINNIPMSILFANIVDNKEAIFASIIGSNIGAFLTPIGALAGIMFTNLVNKYDTKYSYLDFIKYGSIISIPIMVVSLGVLYLIML
jgi:arsenical pump membrane protein